MATINCDMGESFGLYKMGDDEALMPFLDIANVACGFHGSDFNHMHETVRLAKRHGVKVGAHPSLPDLQGFGRREMKMKREEIANCLIYQIGALTGFLAAQGMTLNHPWFVSMVGFVAGLPFLYQMVERARQIQSPKYVRPRTDTPKLTVGHGGCFGAIYSVRGAGGYQMFGITPVPIYDPQQRVKYLVDFMCLFNPGDIVKWRPIDRAEYDETVAEVDAGRYAPKIAPVDFSLAAFQADIDGTNAKLMGALHDH